MTVLVFNSGLSLPPLLSCPDVIPDSNTWPEVTDLTPQRPREKRRDDSMPQWVLVPSRISGLQFTFSVSPKFLTWLEANLPRILFCCLVCSELSRADSVCR